MKKLNQTQAIKAFCVSCIVDDTVGGNGSALTQITNCTAIDCPLYSHRPLNQDAKEVEKQKRIDAMSPEEFKAYQEKCDIAKERFNKLRLEGKIGN